MKFVPDKRGEFATMFVFERLSNIKAHGFEDPLSSNDDFTFGAIKLV